MNDIYIVISGGCLQYVSTNNPQLMRDANVHLLDLDDYRDASHPDDIAEMAETKKQAESLVRIW